tara:strand:+ start:4009 stop:4743 length:735 start_codon:yes stop_codon:yes gene_type:complete
MKKSKTRIYINKEISSNLLVYIKNKQHHFLKNVLRIQVNDLIRIFDGKTGEWLTKVLTINRDNTVLRVNEKIRNFDKQSDLWLIFAPIKQHRMSIAIQKATELGVSLIIPCITDFTNIKKINKKNLYLNAVEAAEQSERLDIPEINETIDLKSLLSSWPDDRYLIYCDEKNEDKKNIIKSLSDLKINKKKCAVLVGPEGGFSDEENKLLIQSENIITVNLGKRLLRSDTAIAVSLFCVEQLLNE